MQLSYGSTLRGIVNRECEIVKLLWSLDFDLWSLIFDLRSLIPQSPKL